MIFGLPKSQGSFTLTEKPALLQGRRYRQDVGSNGKLENISYLNNLLTSLESGSCLPYTAITRIDEGQAERRRDRAQLIEEEE
jgi:hypothetical protein